MPMAAVFSPKSSTFLIDNLLKPASKTAGSDDSDSEVSRAVQPEHWTPPQTATCDSTSGNYHHNNSSVSQNSQLPFHPAFRDSQQTTTGGAASVKRALPTPRPSARPSPSVNDACSPSGAGPTRKKKNRTNFTTQQIGELEGRYRTQRYLAPHERSALARSLKLTDRQVKTWFQNRRMKEKRQVADLEPLYPPALAPASHSHSHSHSPTLVPTTVQHHYASTSASAAPPPPPFLTTVAHPATTQLTTLTAAMTRASTVSEFQPLSIAVPSVNPSRYPAGPGLLMVDRSKSFAQL